MVAFNKATSLNFSLLTILLVSSCFSTDAQNHTIKSGDILPFSENLMVSADRRFQLGFFRLSNEDPGGYLGIWYVNDPYTIRFWVANRDTPISGPNASLTFDPDGLLKIVHGDGRNPITINPDPDQKSNNSIATLENSGNLVVKQLNPDGTVKRILWESFDNPTDSLLPGMKLGINFNTGKRSIISSWISEEIPGVGGFTLEYDHREKTLIMKHRGDLYWRSGDKDDVAKHMLRNSSIGDYEYLYNYVSNVNESYFSYSITKGIGTSRWVLYPDGRLGDDYGEDTSLDMVKSNQCQGGFDSSSLDNGCYDQESPSCRNSKKDGFEKRSGYFEKDLRRESYDRNKSVSVGDCWDQCWKDCGCVGFDSPLGNETTCRFWSDGAVFVQSFDEMKMTGTDLYVSRLRFPTNPPRKEIWWIWLVASASAVLILLLSGYLWHLRRKKLKREKEESILRDLRTSDGSNKKEEIIDFDGDNEQELKLFSFASVLVATDNFSNENKLGQGGFGPVFKGILPSGQEIAVKRLSMSSGQGLVEFKNELKLIAKLQHMNLVRLLGCCVRGDEKMLIYEFMPNKSLDFFLFDTKRREELDWKTRYNIIEGTAQGLLYLHRYSRVRIIHRDMKASNILLDNFMNPKISDFGMARIFGRDDAVANTNRVVGTYGYMSPEYAMNGNFSEKSDVYSFGVLLLEILTGRRNNGYDSPDQPLNLVAHAWELWKEGRIAELIDPLLRCGESNRAQIMRCFHVSMLCVEDNAANRPTMSDVLPMLANQTMDLPSPKYVSAPSGHGLKKSSHSSEINSQSSVADASITELMPR